MTAAIGFLMIIAIVALLLKGKMSPIVVLAVIPVIAAPVSYSPLAPPAHDTLGSLRGRLHSHNKNNR